MEVIKILLLDCWEGSDFIFSFLIYLSNFVPQFPSLILIMEKGNIYMPFSKPSASRFDATVLLFLPTFQKIYKIQFHFSHKMSIFYFFVLHSYWMLLHFLKNDFVFPSWRNIGVFNPLLDHLIYPFLFCFPHKTWGSCNLCIPSLINSINYSLS